VYLKLVRLGFVLSTLHSAPAAQKDGCLVGTLVGT